ncbi:DUF4112 domain-containing protein [Sphingomonas sp. TZW2008]|uniref:DUF4112 domain-containing protein n=1 Tax=Sphingomonas sp. TZW2008 TaxID=1917973 RepID=UPI000A269995|nr:DUF4112 domain-containing protein [Sphingomonas sp. TZW2008]
MTQNIPSPDAAAILAALPLGRDPVSIRRRIEAVERVMEGAFEIPGTSRRVGLDTLIGLIPVIGDVVAGAIGAWIVWEARNLGMSRWQLTRMGARVGFDTMLGLVPFVGDAADFFYRSNSRNLRTIKRHLDRNHPATVTINA